MLCDIRWAHCSNLQSISGYLHGVRMYSSNYLDELRTTGSYLNLASMVKGHSHASRLSFRLLFLQSWYTFFVALCIRDQVEVPEFQEFSLDNALEVFKGSKNNYLISSVFEDLWLAHKKGHRRSTFSAFSAKEKDLKLVFKLTLKEHRSAMKTSERMLRPKRHALKSLCKLTPVLLVALAMLIKPYKSWIETQLPLNLADLSIEKVSGYPWDGPGTLKLTTERRIEIGALSHPKIIDLSFDCNDEYLVRFMKNDKEIGRESFTCNGIGGLVARQKELPALVTVQGIDSLFIGGRGGDVNYSIGHVVLK